MIYNREGAKAAIVDVLMAAHEPYDKQAEDIIQAIGPHLIPPKKESGLLPDAAHVALLGELSRAASGYDVRTIVSAALNLVLQATYLAHKDRATAFRAIDEKFAKFKQALGNMYTSAGKKGGTLEPVTDVLELPRIDTNKRLWTP